MRRKMKKINLFILAATFMVYGLSTSVDVAYAQDAAPYKDIVESARNAGIDQARLDAVMLRAQERGVSGEQFGSMMQPAISLANSNLPYEPVLQKVMEGLAKRVPAPQISQVLLRIESGLNRSAVIVDGWLGQEQTQNMIRSGSRGRDVQQATAQFRNQMLENSAQALQQNIREEHLASLLSQIVAEQAADRAGLGSVASAVGILGDLPTSETDPELSNRIVISALRSGFSVNEMQQLPAALNAAQLQSRLPAAAVANGMAEQALSGVPAGNILENLFKGNLKGGPPGFTPPGQANPPGRDGEDNRRRPNTPPGPPGN
ncbi:MAG: hypothetical protein EA364_06030 [Balneolaceae bacterium]|nr:MAG: hypothetical protein EA364_06030 [Balneolaceae bacterium]